MKLRTRIVRRAGFTLAEVLAALAFMAIVIPVAVQGMQIANRAGQVALRKAAAAQLGDRLLNEMIVTKAWKDANQSGAIQEGPFQYQWKMRNQAWEGDSLKLVTLDVIFKVQGQEHDVRLTTVLDTATE